jgi:hypothetical protein
MNRKQIVPARETPKVHFQYGEREPGAAVSFTAKQASDPEVAFPKGSSLSGDFRSDSEVLLSYKSLVVLLHSNVEPLREPVIVILRRWL